MADIQLQPADYVLCGLAIVTTVTGLFRGFSGTLAFILASAAAAAAGFFGWPLSLSLTDTPWLRGAGVLVATLLVFGIVRYIVKKLVNGLLAQPSDALFGAAMGVLIGAAVPVIWAWTGFHTEMSSIVSATLPYVR